MFVKDRYIGTYRYSNKTLLAVTKTNPTSISSTPLLLLRCKMGTMVSTVTIGFLKVENDLGHICDTRLNVAEMAERNMEMSERH
jgi:hypothetical protein